MNKVGSFTTIKVDYQGTQKSTQLSEYAFSLGAGFPVGRSYVPGTRTASMINVGLEYGQRGTIDNGLIKENFIRVRVGFTINDEWFIKRVYD